MLLNLVNQAPVKVRERVPLKQGLKHHCPGRPLAQECVRERVPLKQGLKQE